MSRRKVNRGPRINQCLNQLRVFMFARQRWCSYFDFWVQVFEGLRVWFLRCRVFCNLSVERSFFRSFFSVQYRKMSMLYLVVGFICKCRLQCQISWSSEKVFFSHQQRHSMYFMLTASIIHYSNFQSTGRLCCIVWHLVAYCAAFLSVKDFLDEVFRAVEILINTLWNQ